MTDRVAPVSETSPDLERVGDPPLPVLVWRLRDPMVAVASAPLGGGIGLRHWVLNAQVPSEYVRVDVDAHLRAIADATGCPGIGVGFLTATPVEQWTTATDGGVEAYATVGLHLPTWAAATAERTGPAAVGTVNVVAFVPARLSDAALVNTIITATEAKTQALLECGVAGTGTASDAVCVLARADGDAEAFAGPRSRVGASLARAVHAAVRDGAVAWTRAQADGS